MSNSHGSPCLEVNRAIKQNLFSEHNSSYLQYQGLCSTYVTMGGDNVKVMLESYLLFFSVFVFYSMSKWSKKFIIVD